MNPKSVRIFSEGDVGAHRENIGVDRHREHDRRKDRENFHGEIEFVGEEGIIGRLERFDDFLVVFEDVPESNIGADQILEIDFESAWDERTLFLKERLDDGTLRLECSAKVQDVALHDGYLEDHFFFFPIEYAVFDGVKVFRDMVEAREAGTEKHFEDVIHEVGGCFTHKNAPLSLAFFECSEKIRDLVDIIFVAGDEVSFGEDNVHLAGIGGAIGGVEEGDVDGEEEAVFESDGFGLIGRRRKLLDRDRMDIEVFLEMENVFRSGIGYVEPGDGAEGNTFHVFLFERGTLSLYHTRYEAFPRFLHPPVSKNSLP